MVAAYGQSGLRTPLRRSSSRAWRRCFERASRTGPRWGWGWPDAPPRNSSAPPAWWWQSTSCRSSGGGFRAEETRGAKVERREGEKRVSWQCLAKTKSVTVCVCMERLCFKCTSASSERSNPLLELDYFLKNRVMYLDYSDKTANNVKLIHYFIIDSNTFWKDFASTKCLFIHKVFEI